MLDEVIGFHLFNVDSIHSLMICCILHATSTDHYTASLVPTEHRERLLCTDEHLGMPRRKIYS